MKEYLVELTGAARSPLQARHLAREYLQARILGSLQRAGLMVPLAFHGGTALRFLYGLPRYSEDLDFALERLPDLYSFRRALETIQSDLIAEGYPIELKANDQNVVHAAFVRFRGLWHELGLSPHADETLAIKLEVDTRPPSGAGLTTTIVRRYVPLHLQHHDQATLLAGKLHAVLQRPYAKGRDFYDLFWYLSDPSWPPPNLTLLNNALRQTGGEGPPVWAGNWRTMARERVESLAWAEILRDVAPFLMDTLAGEAFTQVNLLRLLEP